MISIIRGSVNCAKELINEEVWTLRCTGTGNCRYASRTLTGLEREEIENEYNELMERIAELKAILADEKKLLAVIREEILNCMDKYGDDRRTSIGYDEFDISMEDLIPETNTSLP